MDQEVSSSQLRNALHEVIQLRQAEIDEIIPKHADSLKELYLMLEPRRKRSEDFPPIGEEDALDENVVEEGFQQWKERYELGEGSSISSLILPSLPPVSPPATSTVFPDEVPTDQQTETSTSSKSPFPPSGVSQDRPIAPIKSPKAQKPFVPLLLSPSPPPDDSEPSMGIAMDQIQPRPRLIPSTSFAPPAKLEVPEWIPVDNYHPAELPDTSPKIFMPLETDYASQLPRLPPLPPQIRQVQGQGPAKKRIKLNDSVDLYKLQVSFTLNPLSGSLSKSSKCVLTNDWKIALNEMRHVRAMERIETKKNENRWSLRQPKKLRTLPVPKSHWDFLLEEMEWMRVDFNEERKWKLIQAREFAYQVVEWHLSTEEEKAKLMVGNRGWGKSNDQPIPGHSGNRETNIQIDGQQGQGQLEVPNTSAEDDDVEMLIGREEDSPAEEGVAGAEVLESIDEMKEVQDEVVKKENEDVEMGEDADADGEEDADGEPDDGGTADADGEEEDAEGEEDVEGEAEDVGEDVVGLDDIDNADESDREASEVRRDTVLPNGLVINKRFANVEELVAARKPLLDLSFTSTTVDLDSLPQLTAASTNTEDLAEPQTPPSLVDLFPDLAVYQGPQPPSEDKPTRRLDEGQTNGYRIAHTSRIMDIRPILVSTLQPAKNAPDGVWDIHEGPYFEDPKSSTDVNPTVVAATSSVFYGRGIRPLDSMRPPEQPKPPAQHLRAQLVWSQEDDEHLLKLVATYPFHWQLIADSFNTEKVNIPTEKRSAYECWERWYYTYSDGKDKLKKAEALAQASASVAPTPSGDPTTAATPTAAPPSGTTTPAPFPPTSAIPPSTAASSRPGNQTPQSAGPQQTPVTGISVPSLPTPTPGSAATASQAPGTAGAGTPLPEGAPPPPGMSKRDRQAAKPRYEGTKSSIRHQAIYDAARKLNRRREANKTKTGVKDQPKKIINVHESHASYLMSSISTPWELVETKYQRDVQAMQQRQQRAMQEQQRQIALRQQMMQQQQQAAQAAQQAQQQQAAQGQQQSQQQTVPQPGQPQPQGQGQPIQPTPQPQNQQPQMRPPPNAPVRMGPNGQPMPNMAPSQQQLLNAVVAANAVNRQNVNAVPGQGNVRPNPQQQQQQQQQQVQQGPTIQVQQQMQLLQAQQIAATQAQLRAAQQAQLQAQAQAQVQGRMSQSPYNQHGTPLPNGDPSMANSSPAMTQASPQQRVPSGQPVPQHLRVASAGSQGSPQMSSPIPVQHGVQAPQINNAAMQQIIAQLAANGQQANPEQIRALMMRNAQMQAAAQVQAQVAAAQQQGQVNPGTPQMGMQGVQHFARSPSIQNNQIQARNSPKPNQQNQNQG
ncbi:hypothetical protein I203_101265 [Kwoniella mangroviensis CBS 8507]|uniref:uncharacterized protein n=1 Tax=Kwoniella mangroviensis CBS 8507 TaxID=1296122 RepID=UPI00080D7FF2|nr:uncharacterized protein I203_02901 [Kwoniella mangroviensis CBS 8507]OCF68238.1 hypothetical protein I203_02901 [Kwoniella mangroviensis CBS 8507]